MTPRPSNSSSSPEVHYDGQADVLYIDIDTNEPSYTINIDDFVLLDIGHISGLPTGFRLLSPSRTHGHFTLELKAVRRIKPTGLVQGQENTYNTRMGILTDYLSQPSKIREIVEAKHPQRATA